MNTAQFQNSYELIENIKLEQNNLNFNNCGNCWHKCISQALPLLIRKKVYEKSKRNINYYKENNITINTECGFIPLSEYINTKKFSQQWAGDFEISETSNNIFNIVIYKVATIINNNIFIKFYNFYGNFDEQNRNTILVCLVNNSHYQLIY